MPAPARPRSPLTRAPAAWRLVVLLALAPGAAACWTRAAPAGERTTLAVENQSTFDMTMYVYRGAARSRLGVARSLSTSVLDIPSSVVGTGAVLRFVGDPLAGQRSPVSEEFNVQPGTTVRLRIPPQ